MREGDQDTLGVGVSCLSRVRRKPIHLFGGQVDEVKLQTKDAVGCGSVDRFKQNHVCLDRTVHTRSGIVLSRTPHTMVDPDRRCDVSTGVAEFQDRCGCVDVSGRHWPTSYAGVLT